MIYLTLRALFEVTSKEDVRPAPPETSALGISCLMAAARIRNFGSYPQRPQNSTVTF